MKKRLKNELALRKNWKAEELRLQVACATAQRAEQVARTELASMRTGGDDTMGLPALQEVASRLHDALRSNAQRQADAAPTCTVCLQEASIFGFLHMGPQGEDQGMHLGACAECTAQMRDHAQREGKSLLCPVCRTPSKPIKVHRSS